MRKPSTLTVPQTCMTANFYDVALDYPEESFEKITRRMLGAKGFPIKAATFERDCRKACDLGRKK